MNNPENLQSEDVSQNEQPIEGLDANVEQVEEAELAEIQEVQAELQEGVKELNENLDELEELQSEETLSEKAKKVLSAGLKEIKNYIQANPMVNILAQMELAGGVGLAIRDLAEGKDIKEVASNVLGQVVFWGITKAVAYLGWGRKAQQEEMARIEKYSVAQEMVPVKGSDEVLGAQPVDEVEEVPVDDEAENQIKELKGDLEKKYNDKAE